MHGGAVPAIFRFAQRFQRVFKRSHAEMCHPQKKPDRSLAWIQICRLQKEALRLDQIVELFQFQQSQLHVRLPVARRFLQLLLTYSPVQLIPF
jgi:hypothetical protein